MSSPALYFLWACLILGTSASAGLDTDSTDGVEGRDNADHEVHAETDFDDDTDHAIPPQGAGWRARQKKTGRMKKLVFVSDTRIVLVRRKSGDILEDCLTHNLRSGIRTEARGATAINITETQMDDMYVHCQMFKSVKDGLHGLQRRKRLVISPGTKWCGMGNIASDYDDLGELEAIDTCCRSHDHCTPSIGAMESKYGLTNFALWAKAHCDCDAAFYDCLKAAGDTAVGDIYFNQISVGCIAEDYPLVCEVPVQSGKTPRLKNSATTGHLRKGLLGICTEYAEDTSQAKVMMFKDNTLVY